MSLSSIIADDALGSGVPPDASVLRAWQYEPNSVIGELVRESGAFDFFHAVSLIESLPQNTCEIGKAAHPAQETLRFRSAFGAAFPSSAICETLPPTDTLPQAEMTVALFGLTGPSGILPRHYTQLLQRIQRDARGTEKHALRDWFDLFNHRLISQFYQAWKKYRFFSETRPHACSEHVTRSAFGTAIFSFAGLGLPQFHNRLQVSAVEGDVLSRRERSLARVNDLAIARYAGLFTQRPRTAANLKQILRDYFGLPMDVQQFQGQWLTLDEPQQTQLGAHDGDANNQLGVSAIVGSQVWDVASKFRVRLGPLKYRQFADFLPDRSPTENGKSFFLLCQLTRLFAGPEFDLDVQLVLDRNDVPSCRLSSDAGDGARLGWNTWLCNRPPESDAGDAHFEADESERLETDSLWPRL